jgi:hypothetical protein
MELKRIKFTLEGFVIAPLREGDFTRILEFQINTSAAQLVPCIRFDPPHQGLSTLQHHSS